MDIKFTLSFLLITATLALSVPALSEASPSLSMSCPSPEVINQALANNNGILQPGYQLPEHPGFSTPWTFLGVGQSNYL